MLGTMYRSSVVLAYYLSDCLYFAKRHCRGLFEERVACLVGAYRMYCAYEGIADGYSTWSIMHALDRMYSRIAGEWR